MEVVRLRGDPGLRVRGIGTDSRCLRGANVFVALRGSRTDGHRHLREAIGAGAEALVVEDDPGLPVTTAVVRDTRRALGRLCAELHGRPSSGLLLVGVTGTNGKTTTAHLLEAILRRAGHRPALLGTLGYRFEGWEVAASHTTPDPLRLQPFLAEARRRGATAAVMEASSHGLHQHRLEGCELDAGVFTCLGHDHLDYHRTPEEYLRSKRRLFELVANGPKPHRLAVVNADDPASAALIEGLDLRVVSFGRRGDVRPRRASLRAEGIRAALETPWGTVEVRSRLLGWVNLLNVMAAAATALALGLDRAAVSEGIADLQGVPGRLEPVGDGPVRGLVDYAHTPDALQTLLGCVRPLARRVLLVFGCGGERDRSKRAPMGEIAARLADLPILTTDNPRMENPLRILREVERGLQRGGRRRGRPGGGLQGTYLVIPDRQEAIHTAVRLAEPGDLVVVAGKGHERHQLLGGRALPFDDREVLRRALGQWAAS